MSKTKPIVKLKNSTKDLVKKSKLKQSIIDEIQQLPEFDKDFKYDVELIQSILQIIEYKFYKKYDEFQKKQIAIDILTQLFQLSKDEISIIQKSINYIYENKIIKKTSNTYKVFNVLKKFVLKKLGF